MLFKRVGTCDDAGKSLLIIYPEEIIAQIHKDIYLEYCKILNNLF